MRTLYTVPTANGQRASIALEECGLDYRAVSVDLYAGEHRSAEMLALNPFGRMPVLAIDSDAAEARTIYGSLAIGLYAAETTGLLLPPEAERNRFNQWIGIVMTDLVPAFAAQFYLGTLSPEPSRWAIDFYDDIIGRFLGGIDAHLRDSEYFLGSAYTLVDVLMYPTAATSLARTAGGLRPYANIERWTATVAARDAVRRGMASSS